MSGEIYYYFVHTNYWPFFLRLMIGWLILFVGVLRYGRRLAFFALPLGIAIPLSNFASPGLWRGLFDAETLIWNAAYWLLPGTLITAIALLCRRKKKFGPPA